MVSSLKSALDLSNASAATLARCLRLLSAGVWAQQVTNTSNLPRLLAEGLIEAKALQERLGLMLEELSASTMERVA